MIDIFKEVKISSTQYYNLVSSQIKLELIEKAVKEEKEDCLEYIKQILKR